MIYRWGVIGRVCFDTELIKTSLLWCKPLRMFEKTPVFSAELPSHKALEAVVLGCFYVLSYFCLVFPCVVV